MTNSLPTVAKARATLADLSSTHAQLVQIFDELSHFERVWRPQEKAWSCAEIMGHLVDAEIAFAWRIRLALAEPGQSAGSFNQDAWVSAQRWNDLPVGDSLHVFQALRQATVHLLAPLSDEEWSRHYLHSVRGSQTVVETVLFLHAHDNRHLLQLGRTAELARDASRRGSRGVSFQDI
ncbi:MAG: DinB family protein [Fibrobacteria bacterium]|nr:DinB family protein [Fibrobacteria bacterium]